MSEVEALTARVAALETALASHRRTLEAILASPPVKMALRGAMPLSDLKITHEARAEPEKKVHPYDAAIKAGDKLKALAHAADLQR